MGVVVHALGKDALLASCFSRSFSPRIHHHSDKRFPVQRKPALSQPSKALCFSGVSLHGRNLIFILCVFIINRAWSSCNSLFSRVVVRNSCNLRTPLFEDNLAAALLCESCEGAFRPVCFGFAFLHWSGDSYSGVEQI